MTGDDCKSDDGLR